MHTPHVSFLLPSAPREARTFTWFCTPRPTGWDWSHIIFARHPELGEALAGVKDEDDVYRRALTYVRSYRTRHASALEKSLGEQEAIWRSVEQPFLRELPKTFETPYPPGRTKIRAYVSIVPIYPRWLDEWSFNTSFFNPSRVRAIACHEILHFMYYKKWMEVFPETRPEERNQPHLVWRLSEVLDPVILNEHPVLGSLVGSPQSPYRELERVRMGRVRPSVYFTRMYRKHLKSKAPFADFLREANQAALQYEPALMGA